MLQQPAEEDFRPKSLKAYVTPQAHHWDPWLAAISHPAAPKKFIHEVLSFEELKALAPVELHVDFNTKRGGNASVTSRQKKSLIRARWKPRAVPDCLRSEQQRRAYQWLLNNNQTYRIMVDKHNALLNQRNLDGTQLWIPTAELLLRLPGLEVAARPWLYPYAAFGDTDLADRLKPLGLISAASTPSLKTSSYRKMLSRCVDYAEDYILQCFLYDVAMARQISSVVSMADKKKMAPEIFASEMPAFEMYWHREGQKLEDICRQQGRLPELFFTLAPAEWKFQLHEGALPPAKDSELSKHQPLLTLHMYNSMQALLRRLLFEDAPLSHTGFAPVMHCFHPANGFIGFIARC